MSGQNDIPLLGLYGETAEFPETIHLETLSVRASQHDWRILPHRHGRVAQLFLLRTGGLVANVDGQRYVLGGDSFLFVSEYSVHELTFQPGSEGDVISFPSTVLQSAGPTSESVRSALSRPFSGHASEVLSASVAVMRDRAENGARFAVQQMTGMAHFVLSYLAEIASDASPASALSERLQALDLLVQSHLADGWGAVDFAAALSLSTGHLSRLCRNATGQGATAYIERRRIAEACRLLAFTKLSVAEIGYRVGYADPSYFTRRFRAVRLQTPTEFRELSTQ